MLFAPGFEKKFKLDVDSDDVRAGAVLLQGGDNKID